MLVELIYTAVVYIQLDVLLPQFRFHNCILLESWSVQREGTALVSIRLSQYTTHQEHVLDGTARKEVRLVFSLDHVSKKYDGTSLLHKHTHATYLIVFVISTTHIHDEY